MTHAQDNLFVTLDILIGDTQPHINFQLDLLYQTVEADAERLTTCEMLIEENALEIEDLLGSSESYKLNFQIEEKWRIELQETVKVKEAELERLKKNSEASAKRSRAIIQELKGTQKDIGTKKQTMTASKAKS